MSATENRRINIWINGRAIRNDMRSIRREYSKSRNAINGMTRGSREYNREAARMRKLRGIINSHNNAVFGASRAWRQFKTVFAAVGLTNIATAFFQHVGSAIPQLINMTANLSDQFATVQKVTDMTDQEVKNLFDGFSKLDTRTTRSELLGIAETLGRMGREIDEIPDAVAALDKLQVALGDEFGTEAKETADTVARLRNVLTDMQTDNFADDMLHLGNAINTLTNEGMATADVVAAFSNRIGAVGIQLGFTSGEVLGLSAALQELNVAPERGGTAVVKILQEMTTNTETFARVAGMEVGAFTELVNTDLMGALLRVAEGTQESGTKATEFSAVLQDLGLNNARVSEVMAKLAQNTEFVREKTDLATVALTEQNTVMSEFERMNSTLAARIEKLQRRLRGFFLSEGFQKRVEQGVTLLENMVTWLGRNSTAIWNVTKALFILGTGFVSYKAAMAAAVSLQKVHAKWLLINRARKMGVVSATKAQTAATLALTKAMRATPWGLVASGITMAIGAWISYSDSINDATDSLSEHNAESQKTISQQIAEIDAIMAKAEAMGHLSEARLKDLEAAKQGLRQQGTDEQVNPVRQALEDGNLAVLKMEQLNAAVNEFKRELAEAAPDEMLAALDPEAAQEQLEKQKASIHENIKLLEAEIALRNKPKPKIQTDAPGTVTNDNDANEQLAKEAEFLDELFLLRLNENDREIAETNQKYDALFQRAQKYVQDKDELLKIEAELFEMQQAEIAEIAKRHREELTDEELEALERRNDAMHQLDAATAQRFERQIDAQIAHHEELLELAIEYGYKEDEIKELLAELELAREQEIFQEKVRMFTEYYNLAKGVVNNFMKFRSDREQAELARLKRDNDFAKAIIDDRYEQEVISKEAADIEKQRLDEQLRAQEAAIKRSQFTRERAAAITESIVNTAVQVTKHLANPFMAAAVAAAGAVQTGVIARQPIPEYAMGVENAPGGMALVGERGPELVNIPAGSRVNTAAQTSDLLSPRNNALGAGSDQMVEKLDILITEFRSLKTEMKNWKTRIRGDWRLNEFDEARARQERADNLVDI